MSYLFHHVFLLIVILSLQGKVNSDTTRKLASFNYPLRSGLRSFYLENSHVLNKLVKQKAKQNKNQLPVSETSTNNLRNNIHRKLMSVDFGEDPMAEYLARQRRLEPDGWEQTITCDVCELIVKELQDIILNAKTVEEIVEASIALCVGLQIEDQRVCEMAVPLFKDQVIYVVKHLALSPKEACGIILGDTCATPYFPGNMWDVTFPKTPKPTPKPPTPPKPQAPKLRVLQFTDIHIDFQYEEGTVANCGEPTCCRANDNETSSITSVLNVNKATAGKYGTYFYCDVPVVLMENLFQHLSTIQDQFDYIIFTGDIPAHDVWNQTQVSQTNHLIALDRMFLKYLPTKPVYYCVGNHESVPVNSFPPPGIPGHDLGWLYGSMAGIWGRWLPESAIEEVLRCGGYSTSPYPGFRIISVNTNYCNKGSYWLLLNETDPCDVLQWLIQELQSAEDKNEKVHILTHIPPGGRDCLKAWSYNFYKIVNRYENTIVNQFYGHSHHDWFQMFYDDVTFQRPVGVGFVMSSVTPDSIGDPIYRIYTIDGNYPNSSWAVLDYESFYFNLTDANLYNKLEWKLEYSPKTAYNMSSLYAADWEDLLQRMKNDDNLFQLFYKFNRNLRPSACDDKCKEDVLCGIIQGRSYDPDLCRVHK